MKFARPSRFIFKQYWIIWFYLSVLLLYGVVFYPAFIDNLKLPNGLIAPIMAFGSFVAGSTFLGGGAVAFPALTKILHFEPEFAKVFSLAIQSVGMSSATVYIVYKVKKLPLVFISLYTLGSTVGLWISLSLLAKHIPAVDLRILFSLFLLCFLTIYLITRQVKQSNLSLNVRHHYIDYLLVIGFGICGGLISGLIGSGADVISFCLMALYFRMDIKRATQISVVLMAITSVIGTSMLLFSKAGISQELVKLWYLAAPVVIVGAPFGAMVCNRISAKKLLIFISGIVIFEVTSTVFLVPLAPSRTLLYLSGALASIGLLSLLVYLAKRKQAYS